MKIAFVVRKFPTLSETFILNQIIGLIDRGHSVDIYTIYLGDIKNTHHDFYRYNLLERTYYPPQVPYNPALRIFKAIYLFVKKINRAPLLIQSLNIFKYGRQAASLYLFYLSLLLDQPQNYDIIHCHFGLIGLIGVDLRDLKLLTGKVVTSFHGFDVNVYPRLHGNEVYNRLIEKGNLYTANSYFTANKLLKIGFNQEKILKLPVGVDINYYNWLPKTYSPNETINILTIGRLVECKGIEYAIRALAKVIKVYPNIKYKIVGEGQLKSKLENIIQELGVQNKVNLVGRKTRQQLKQIYAESHIFVLSSIIGSDGSQEGQGLVLQEAQAARLPVVTTNIGGIPEGVLEGKSGFLVAEQDIEALAEKLIYLLGHPEIWAEMGQAGNTFVAENYSIETVNDYLVEKYKLLLI